MHGAPSCDCIRSWRAGAALRLAAGVQLGHALRQHRQRLADRRFHAHPDRAGRAGRAAPWQTDAHACRSISFYLGYQKKDLQPGEFVVAVTVPRAAAGQRIASYKVSKRFDQDISAVCAGFAFNSTAIASSRLGWRSAAWRRFRLARRSAEAALLNKDWSSTDCRGRGRGAERGLRATDAICAPAASIGCWQPRQLLRRFYRETQGEPVASLQDTQRRWQVSHERRSAHRRRTCRANLIAHESAHLHVTGRGARTATTLPLPANTLHAAFGLSRSRTATFARWISPPCAARRALSLSPCRRTFRARTTMAASVHDDPIFADGLVQYAGQPLFAVAATSYSAARSAVRKAQASNTTAARDPRHQRGAGSAELRAAVSAHRARLAAEILRDVAASAARHGGHRRPGSLLSRRPDRGRASRRKTAAC